MKNYMPATRFTHQKGFTLVEVIVVTAIIGIMAAFLVGALVQDSDRAAKLEAQRFISVAQEVSDEAIFSGAPHKIIFQAGGYKVEPLVVSAASVDTEQANSTLNELHRARKVAAEVRFKVLFFDLESNDEGFEPSILIDSLGELSPFEVKFMGDNTDFVVGLDDAGQLELRTESRAG